MATRLFFTNSTTTYTPATIRGGWDATASAVIKDLAQSPGGATTTVAIAEAVSTNNFDVLMYRGVTKPLSGTTVFKSTDTWQSVLGLLESSTSQNAFSHFHVFATVGTSDTLRGTLISNITGSGAAEEWPSSAAGQLFMNTTANALSAGLTVYKGDRLVVEFGYQDQESSSTSFTGTLNYGGAFDSLTDTSTSVTTLAGWIEFSTNFSLTTVFPNNYQFVNAPTGISVTEKIR